MNKMKKTADKSVYHHLRHHICCLERRTDDAGDEAWSGFSLTETMVADKSLTNKVNGQGYYPEGHGRNGN
jgi:hypothetical protein